MGATDRPCAKWIRAALFRGERLKDANALIRSALARPGSPTASESEPADPEPSPNSGAAIMNALNEGGFSAELLVMFGKGGKYPGRLEADTEAELKRLAWSTLGESLDPEGPWQARMAGYLGHKYEIFPLAWGRMWGTENQDFRRKPGVYFALAALGSDPAYTGKSIGGHTVADWFKMMNDHMKEYMKDRVLTGLWIEPGGHYAHITYEVLLTLYELAPDPMLRRQARMFLDLALIEEEQISVGGLRGGGRSRCAPLAPTTKGFLETIFGQSPGEILSDYQAPPVAIVLHNARGPARPYHVYNRLPGENAAGEACYAKNSRLGNYAYRTPAYLMGCALQDPNLSYHPSSSQRRWGGLLFQSGEAVYPWPKEAFTTKNSGRSGNACWSIQHDNVLLVQKLRKSESVDRMEVVFSPELKLTERDGWLFAEAKSGYAAVGFIDPQAPSALGKYDLTPAVRKKRQPVGLVAMPRKDFLPIVIHAGEPGTHGTFEKFQQAILAGKLLIHEKACELEYRRLDGSVITWCYNADANPLPLARVDGKTPNLQPAWLFDSPFLRARWEDPRIYAGAGPFRAVYDFATNEVRTWNQ